MLLYVAVLPQTRISVASETLDFKNGIDGSIATCKRRLTIDPMDGTVFIFTSQKRKKLPVIFYNGQGFWIYTEQLSSGKFPNWPEQRPASQHLAEQVYLLSRGGAFSRAKRQADWR